MINMGNYFTVISCPDLLANKYEAHLNISIYFFLSSSYKLTDTRLTAA